MHSTLIFRIQFQKGANLSISVTSTNVGTAGFLLHNWHTSGAAVLWPSSVQYVQAVASGLDFT